MITQYDRVIPFKDVEVAVLQTDVIPGVFICVGWVKKEDVMRFGELHAESMSAIKQIVDNNDYTAMNAASYELPGCADRFYLSAFDGSTTNYQSAFKMTLTFREVHKTHVDIGLY